MLPQICWRDKHQNHCFFTFLSYKVNESIIKYNSLQETGLSFLTLLVRNLWSIGNVSSFSSNSLGLKRRQIFASDFMIHYSSNKYDAMVSQNDPMPVLSLLTPLETPHSVKIPHKVRIHLKNHFQTFQRFHSPWEMKEATLSAAISLWERNSYPSLILQENEQVQKFLFIKCENYAKRHYGNDIQTGRDFLSALNWLHR